MTERAAAATTPWLTDAEVRDLTRRKQAAAQIRHLTRMGIKFRVRADGTPCVWRWDMQQHEQKAKAASAQPNWSRRSAA